MMSEREWRPKLFSPRQKAECEYLINSHQTQEDLLSCAAEPRHPKASRALRPEQWSMNAPTRRVAVKQTGMRGCRGQSC